MKFFSLVFSLVILMDAPGNVPLYIALLKDFKPKRQKIIILREMFIALVAMLFFAFIGNEFLSFLDIKKYAIQIAGGVILFLMALKMVFPATDTHRQVPIQADSEPFIVPLAIPLIAGPGVLSSLMVYADEYNSFLVIGAATLAWLFSLFVLIFAPFISKVMGKRGLMAIERLMGLVLILIASDMFFQGISLFINVNA